MKYMHTAFVPPITIDNSKRLDEIEQHLKNIDEELAFFTALEARFRNMETMIKQTRQIADDILELLNSLHRREEKNMERITDLEHATNINK